MFRLVARIAWASLVRRRSRSLLVVLMIAISLWGLLFMEGIYDGMTEQMIANAIRSDSGHISIFAKGYRRDPDLSRQVEEVEEITSLLAAGSRVSSHVQRLKQDGLVATAHYSRAAAICGVDLAAENGHGSLASYLQAGEYDFGRRGQGAIIGFKLADKLQVRIGNKIILSGQDSQGEVSAAPFKVVGILKSNNMVIDERVVFIQDSKARQLLALATGVSQIAIILPDESQIAALQQELISKFPHLDILRWDQLYPALLQSRVMMEGFNLVVSVLIFCVAGLGIFGVMLVSVLERLREFGIMLALGTSFRQISAIIMAESFCLGFLGLAWGWLLGGASLYYFKVKGLDLSMFSSAFDEFGMDAVTYALIRPSYFITALLAVTIASLLSVLIPLRVLAKAKPMEAIAKV